MGLRVYTGLDPDVQQAAQRALLAQIGRIEGGTLRPLPARGAGQR